MIRKQFILQIKDVVKENGLSLFLYPSSNDIRVDIVDKGYLVYSDALAIKDSLNDLEKKREFFINSIYNYCLNKQLVNQILNLK